MAALLMAPKIRKMTSEERLTMGKRLPSERSIAAEFGESRQAAHSALRESNSERWVLRSPERRPIVLGNGNSKSRISSPVADQIAIWMLPDSQDFDSVAAPYV